LATVKEIAEKAKVSIGTVDRVMHNRGRVSNETRLRVESIIRELDFRPNFFAKNLKRGQNYRFAILMPKVEQDNSFWSLIFSGMQRAIKELSAYNIVVSSFFFDRTSERSFSVQSKKALAFEPDGLIMTPLLTEGFKQFIGQIPGSVPYIFVDTTLEGGHPISYIGHQPFQSGFLAGKLMKLLSAGRDGSIAIIRSYLQEYHMDQRARGFHAFFDTDKALSLVDYNITGIENKENYYRVIDNCLRQNSDIIGIFVTNVYANFVADFFAERSNINKPFIIGYDLVKENIKYLKEGGIDFLISHRPDMQGYNAVMQLYDFRVIKRSVNFETSMPIDIITKENIEFI
jgi:LacI family transcriptional regulator